MSMEVRRQILPFLTRGCGTAGLAAVGGQRGGQAHAAENAHADHFGLSLRRLTQARQSWNDARVA